MRGTRAKQLRRDGKRKQPRHKRFNEIAFRNVLNLRTKESLRRQCLEFNLTAPTRLTKEDLVNLLVEFHRTEHLFVKP